jgi:hypothetical protein
MAEKLPPEGRVQQVVIQILTDPAVKAAYAAGDLMSESGPLSGAERDLLATVNPERLAHFERSLHYKQLRISRDLMPTSVSILEEAIDSLALGAALWRAAAAAGSIVQEGYREKLVDQLVTFCAEATGAGADPAVLDAVRFEAACARASLAEPGLGPPAGRPGGARIRPGVTVAAFRTDVASCWPQLRGATAKRDLLARLPVAADPTWLVIFRSRDDFVRVIRVGAGLATLLTGPSPISLARDQRPTGGLARALLMCEREGIVETA